MEIRIYPEAGDTLNVRAFEKSILDAMDKHPNVVFTWTPMKFVTPHPLDPSLDLDQFGWTIKLREATRAAEAK